MQKMICKKKQVNSSLSQFVVRKKVMHLSTTKNIFRDEPKKFVHEQDKRKESLTIVIDVQGEISGGQDVKNFLAAQLTNERLTSDPGHALENEFLHGQEEWWG